MVTLGSLWLPILLSGVALFLASAVMWMFSPLHKSDWTGIGNEDAVASAIRASGSPPGQYMLPWHGGMENMKSPEFQEKIRTGPRANIMIVPNGMHPMGKSMFSMFVLFVLTSLIVGFIGSVALPAGAHAVMIWKVIGITALLAYTVSNIPNAIWFGVPRAIAAENFFDGAIYAAITAAVFVWLWPK